MAELFQINMFYYENMMTIILVLLKSNRMLRYVYVSNTPFTPTILV